jgi:hypothetical protein
MNRWAYWHSVLVATAVTAFAVYYGYWDLIRLRLWAKITISVVFRVP